MGQQQRGHVPTVDSKPHAGPRFAVYLGDGLYLRSLARTPDGRVSVGRDRARRYTRDAAVAALHAVRRAGRGAWLVPHPGAVS